MKSILSKYTFYVLVLIFTSAANGCENKNLIDLSSNPDHLMEDERTYNARRDFSEKLLNELEVKGYSFFTMANFNGNQNNVIGIEWLKNGNVNIKITHSKIDTGGFNIILKIIENNFKKTNVDNITVQLYIRLLSVKELDEKNIKTTNYVWESIIHEKMIKIR